MGVLDVRKLQHHLQGRYGPDVNVEYRPDRNSYTVDVAARRALDITPEEMRRILDDGPRGIERLRDYMEQRFHGAPPRSQASAPPPRMTATEIMERMKRVGPFSITQEMIESFGANLETLYRHRSSKQQAALQAQAAKAAAAKAAQQAGQELTVLGKLRAALASWQHTHGERPSCACIGEHTYNQLMKELEPSSEHHQEIVLTRTVLGMTLQVMKDSSGIVLGHFYGGEK